ncbi:MAG: ABC transporter permease [Actinomycetia bacterium]|nr:ABC transporter permease [Actinomycetes bacterium]
MRGLFENVKIAFKSLYINKSRSILTMLGIIIGVGAVVAVLAIGDGAEQSVLQSVQEMGSNLITITPGGEKDEEGPPMMRDKEERLLAEGELKMEDVKAIEGEATLINEISPMISGSSTVSYQDKNSQVTVSASTEKIVKLQNFQINEGLFYSSSDVANSSSVAVLGPTVADDIFGKRDPMGKIIKIDGKNFTVIGITEPRGADIRGMDQDNTIYIPVTTAQTKLYGSDSFDMIIAQAQSEEVIDEACSEIEEILRAEHNIGSGDSDDFSVRNQSQMVDMVDTILGIFTITLSSIAAISLLVGGIGIMNIMLVSVTERTREIGIRKAVGAKNRDILVQFLTESVALSITGGAIGIGFAILITIIIGMVTTLISAVITPYPIILAISFSTAIGLTFGIYPAMRAARLNPIDALRHE